MAKPTEEGCSPDLTPVDLASGRPGYRCSPALEARIARLARASVARFMEPTDAAPALDAPGKHHASRSAPAPTSSGEAEQSDISLSRPVGGCQPAALPPRPNQPVEGESDA